MAAMVCAWRMPLLGLTARGNVGVEGNEAPARQRIAPDLQLPAAWTRALDGAHAATGAKQLDAPCNLGFDFDCAKFTAHDLGAQNFLHRQADAQHIRQARR